MDSIQKKDDIDNTASDNEKDAVDPKEAAILVPNPTNNGKRCFYYRRPLYLSMLAILVVCVVTAGVLVTLFVVRRPSENDFVLSLGGNHACVTTIDNKLKCWGVNEFGQVGDGTTTNRNLPTNIDLGLNVLVQEISLGRWHTCAITNDNKLKCWGQNEQGQVGDGTRTTRNLPTSIDLGLNVFPQQVALGWYHTCAITNGNNLKCWGYNANGQLGDGTNDVTNLPTNIDLGLNVFPQQVALGAIHTCAITNDNKLKCWGDNEYGQVGDGTMIDRNIPTNIDLGLNAYPQEIALGSEHTCAVMNDNKLKCWGRNEYGQVGDGTTSDRNIPTTIDLGLNAYAQEVALGESYTCAITNDDKLKCWGFNGDGQLGDGTTTDRTTPTSVVE
eukprot:CAMPEP_0203690138 /NCGR_PEP_ID=MMETSP0091-20130426/2510_1 /ASSEMBLY_ACC=CAM_ASM_001089 /TAXON_ID=426623 /ORGANISM="Chaetoceros affinis, Strain CCMP159" /LENGTH=385 /DNA_ID=CAMNT_0050560117 /DNA_START=50 /DNA_END=1207 /DNA_ORIENTATION=+